SNLAFDKSQAIFAASIIKPTLVRRIANELPGIGWERSVAVAAKFSSVAAMMSATQKDWTEIEGIGSKIAKEVKRALSGWGEHAV
ncbi:hypothetical protein LCGC14_2777270, partial [marine sediment metagenome]